MSKQQSINERFEAYHAANPNIYDEMVDIAKRLKARGHDQVSVKALIEAVRLNRMLRVNKHDGDEGYKINNSFAPLYARLIMANEPDLAGIFELRVLRSTEEPVILDEKKRRTPGKIDIGRDAA